MRTLQIVLVVSAMLACGLILMPVAEAATTLHPAAPAARHASPAPHSSGGGHPAHSSGYYGHGYSGYGHGYSGYGHGYSGYGHGYYGHGYYGHGYYGYYPYYRYYYPFALSFGFGYGYGYPYYYPYPYYGYYGGYPYSAAGYYGYGEVRTEVKPKTAQVFVDGGYVGVVDSFDGWWQRLNVEPGNHRLVFRAPGYAPYVIDLRILPGSDYNVKYQMQPGDDKISDQDMRPKQEDNGGYAPRNRNDNRYRNRAPYPERDQGQGYGNDQGQDNGSDQGQGYGNERDREYDPQRPSERNHLEGNMPAEEDQSGRRQITLKVQPSDATVYIDGTYYGTSDGGNVQVMLPDGSHKIEVVRPGYESFEKNIQVGQNSMSSMTIMLQKK